MPLNCFNIRIQEAIGMTPYSARFALRFSAYFATLCVATSPALAQTHLRPAALCRRHRHRGAAVVVQGFAGAGAAAGGGAAPGAGGNIAHEAVSRAA